MANITVWRSFTLEHGGRLVSGSHAYFPDEKLVRVRTTRGEKSAPLDGKSPWDVARLLLMELAAKGKT